MQQNSNFREKSLEKCVITEKESIEGTPKKVTKKEEEIEWWLEQERYIRRQVRNTPTPK